MLFRFVIAFLPRSKRLWISWMQSPPAVILEPKKIVCRCFPLFLHLFAMKWWDQMPWSLFSECWVISQLFHFPVSPSSRGFFCYCINLEYMYRYKYEYQGHKKRVLALWYIAMPVRAAPNFFFCPTVFHERMLKTAVSQPFDLDFYKD